MKDKYLKNSLLLILLLIMSVVVLGQNQALGILGIVLSLVAFGAEISFSHRQNWRVRRQISQISQEVEGLNQEKLYDLPLPMVVTSDAGLVILANKCFTQCFGLETEAEGKYVHELTGVTLKTLEEGKPHTFTWKDNEYMVIDTRFSRDGQPLHLLHFADLRIRKAAGRKNRPNETVFAYILIDNYDDIIEQLPAMERSTVLSRVTISLTDWANRLDAFILEYENDHYVMIFERDKLVEMEDEKFKILDEVRESGDSMRVTLSIGIGVSEKHLSVTEMDELSHAALDFALARGGDQCVVRNDEKMSFYGGKTEATEKRTKVKARVKAHALRELVRNADNVLIMGHQTPDMDCVGSAVGLMGACRAMNKDVRFILREMNYSISSLLDYLSGDPKYEHAFITPAESEAYIRPDTLLIVVDTQSSGYVEIPELTNTIKNMVVIDHHRRSGQGITRTVFDYVESYASSTCELVTELLQYFNDKEIVGKTEANSLLAGMCMDTKMFTVKTGVRTFEAASYLKRKGADTVIAKTLLQNDIQTYAAKSDAVRGARFYENTIAISSFEDHSVNAKVIAAQAADELLNIRGINASFIILKTDGGIFISGRSMGDINVQLILEKLGGGGHLTIAGAQLREVEDLEEAEKMLTDAIAEYKAERSNT